MNLPIATLIVIQNYKIIFPVWLQSLLNGASLDRHYKNVIWTCYPLEKAIELLLLWQGEWLRQESLNTVIDFCIFEVILEPFNRVHPGETPASFIMEGFLDFITNIECELASFLRLLRVFQF